MARQVHRPGLPRTVNEPTWTVPRGRAAGSKQCGTTHVCEALVKRRMQPCRHASPGLHARSYVWHGCRAKECVHVHGCYTHKNGS